MSYKNKYIGLIALIAGLFLTIILIVTALFYLLKLSSFLAMQIPGINNLYAIVILLVPYIIYYCCYFYLLKKIINTKSVMAKRVSAFFLTVGITVATITLALAFMVFFKINANWVRLFKTYSHYSFIAQILFLFATSIAIASGDEKEKDWMHREQSGEPTQEPPTATPTES